MSRSKPTAADRTLSLFTRATDLDGRDARDGTPPTTLPTWPSPPPNADRWRDVHGSLSEWIGPAGRTIFLINGVFVLRAMGRVVGFYASLADAIAGSKS